MLFDHSSQAKIGFDMVPRLGFNTNPASVFAAASFTWLGLSNDKALVQPVLLSGRVSPKEGSDLLLCKQDIHVGVKTFLCHILLLLQSLALVLDMYFRQHCWRATELRM